MVTEAEIAAHIIVAIADRPHQQSRHAVETKKDQFHNVEKNAQPERIIHRFLAGKIILDWIVKQKLKQMHGPYTDQNWCRQPVQI